MTQKNKIEEEVRIKGGVNQKPHLKRPKCNDCGQKLDTYEKNCDCCLPCYDKFIKQQYKDFDEAHFKGQ